MQRFLPKGQQPRKGVPIRLLEVARVTTGTGRPWAECKVTRIPNHVQGSSHESLRAVENDLGPIFLLSDCPHDLYMTALCWAGHMISAAETNRSLVLRHDDARTAAGADQVPNLVGWEVAAHAWVPWLRRQRASRALSWRRK